MSEIKSELDEMEQQSYSINSNTMDPKNNEELIIYVSFSDLFTLKYIYSIVFLLRFRFKIYCRTSKINSNACLNRL